MIQLNKNHIKMEEKMFSKDELLVIKDALKIADEKYMKDLEKSQSNKANMVSNNRKQKKLWLVQNKVKKLIDDMK